MKKSVHGKKKKKKSRRWLCGFVKDSENLVQDHMFEVIRDFDSEKLQVKQEAVVEQEERKRKASKKAKHESCAYVAD